MEYKDRVQGRRDDLLRALSVLTGDSNSVLPGHSQPPVYNSSFRGPSTQGQEALMIYLSLPPKNWALYMHSGNQLKSLSLQGKHFPT